jgi:hypothetical protein
MANVNIQIGSLVQPCNDEGKINETNVRCLPIAWGGPYEVKKVIVCRDGTIAYVVKIFSSTYFVPAYQIVK